MVHKYYADMVAGMETAGELLHRQETARSDEAARRMINRYVAGQAVRMVAESTVETEKVRLTPVLQWGYRQAELTFLVGGARPYVIKDLTKFYNDMQKHEVVEYGKQLDVYKRQLVAGAFEVDYHKIPDGGFILTNQNALHSLPLLSIPVLVNFYGKRISIYRILSIVSS